jgi:hypothetical protein
LIREYKPESFASVLAPLSFLLPYYLPLNRADRLPGIGRFFFNKLWLLQRRGIELFNTRD